MTNIPFTIEDNATGESLEELLERGAIDAFIGADVPEAMRSIAKVRRLFPNFKGLRLPR